MEGTGKSTPMEYNHPGRVSEKVIKDIAEWAIHRNECPIDLPQVIFQSSLYPMREE